MVTLDKALDVVMELSTDDQELLLDIVRRRRVEARRAEIADSLEEARQAWKAGELKARAADDVIAELRASLDDA